MIHQQQAGHQLADIINGLCHALVRNYLNNVGKGKQIKSPILFQGGVAANQGMKRAFEEALQCPVIIPPYYDVMGAIGAAILAKEQVAGKNSSAFRGFDLVDYDFIPRSFECHGCPNLCEVVEIQLNNIAAARWGDRCGKWSNSITNK
jgi:sugar (pentulose or hexulose) kinase